MAAVNASQDDPVHLDLQLQDGHATVHTEYRPKGHHEKEQGLPALAKTAAGKGDAPMERSQPFHHLA